MMDTITSLLSSTLRTLPPVLMAALGCTISSRVGILNMGLEGMMLSGSFVAVITSFYTGSPYLALFAAGLAGAVFGLIFAVFNIRFKANNIVTSVAINLLASGLTVYFLTVLFGVRGAFSSPDIIRLPNLNIPLLSDIPILGAFSGHSAMVYISLLMVVLGQYVMYHTPLGLRIRATGSHDMAVTTAGVNTTSIRYMALVVSGFLCGLGGAHLSIGHLSMFTENMTSGRGFIGMAASIFGKHTPIGSLLGSALFSFADTATMGIQTAGFPPLLIQIVPYLVTIITLWLMAVYDRHRRRS